MRWDGPSRAYEGPETQRPILAGPDGTGEGEGSPQHPRLLGTWWLPPAPRCQGRRARVLGAAAALGLLAAVASIRLVHRGSGPVGHPLAEAPQFLATKPLVGACPGTISVGGVGPVALTNAKWNSPGVPGGEVRLLDGAVAPSMWGRTYFAQTCVEGEYNQSRYTMLKLLGKTLQYMVDLSGAGCGCNVAVYLASIAHNFQASLCSDYYCDAANICGVRCDEIDIQEANKYAWHSTLHVHDDPGGGGIGYGGTLRNNWTVGEYGPGAKCVDTNAPFRVAVSFPVGADGNLLALDIVLSQDAKPCTLTQHVYADHYMYRGRQAGLELSRSLAQGMVPVVSYWSSESLLWLDGRESDGKGGCSRDDPTTCQDTVRLYDFSVTGIQAPLPAPAAAAPSSVAPPPAAPAPPPAATSPGTPSTTPAPTLAPPPGTPAATTAAPPPVTPAAAAPTTAAVTAPPPAATAAPAPVQTPATTAAPPPDHVGGYTKWAADEDAVCSEALRLAAACGMCGPAWGTVDDCSELCDAEPACAFFTFFGDGGCRIYKGCTPVWNQAYGVVTSIFEKGAPGGAAVVQLPPPTAAPDPPGAPGVAPAAAPASPPLYEPRAAAEDEVCDEAGRLPAPCGDCGPKWGDLGKCRAMCDETDQCKFITYFSDEGCRMYRLCDSTWHQSYGAKSSIYRKVR